IGDGGRAIECARGHAVGLERRRTNWVKESRMTESAMSSVEIEAMVGSISSRSALNMRLVKVALSPPAMNKEITTSSSEVMKANSAPEITEILICGSVTVRKAHARVAPRLRATIFWFMS